MDGEKVKPGSGDMLPDAISESTEIRDPAIPTGYRIWRRNVRLLNGAVKPAFYSTHEDQQFDPAAWAEVHESITAGFRWVLETLKVADDKTGDNDRLQEIGNIICYAVFRGLSEQEVVECYKQAFHASKEED